MVKDPTGLVQSRREFLGQIAAGGAALTLPVASALSAEAPTPRERPILAFSKAFQHLNFEDTADLVAEVGFDGIDCPVRKGGQVLPDRVEDDLPRLAAALKKRGRQLPSIVTDVMGAGDPQTERVLRAASKLGIRLYRLGFVNYREDTPLPKQLDEVRARLRDLVALNRELGLCAGFQNHSGGTNIGGPVWDIYEVIRDLDPKYIGAFFDIGHATIEGGHSWQLHARLMQPLFKEVYVKDFTWQKGSRGWESRWCALGEGMISPAFFTKFVRGGFAGPIVQHHEYPIGTGRELVSALKKDLVTLKAWLAA